MKNIFQTLIHYYVFMHPNRTEYQSLLFFAGTHIYKKTEIPSFEKMLEGCARDLLRNVFIIAYLLCSGLVVFLSFPVVMHFFTGERVMVTAAIIPFLNLESTWVYCVTLANQVIVCSALAFFNVGNDCSFMMIINGLWAGVGIVNYSIDEMEHEFERERNVIEQKHQLRHILMQVQVLDR